MIISPASVQEFHAILAAERLVLVDFYADWCEPCKWLDVILDDILTTVPFPLVILKIDTEKFPDLVQEFDIRSVPVVAVFKNNCLIWRINGFLSTTEMLAKLEAISRETP